LNDLRRCCERGEVHPLRPPDEVFAIHSERGDGVYVEGNSQCVRARNKEIVSPARGFVCGERQGAVRPVGPRSLAGAPVPG